MESCKKIIIVGCHMGDIKLASSPAVLTMSCHRIQMILDKRVRSTLHNLPSLKSNSLQVKIMLTTFLLLSYHHFDG